MVKKTTSVGMALACLAFATEAMASTPVEIYGSDTLLTLTRELLDSGECGSAVYLGLGSSRGQNEMCAGNQEGSPMSRALNANACSGSGTTCLGTPDDDTTMRAIARDGIAIARNNPPVGDVCTDIPAATNPLLTIRTIYSGADGTGTNASCNAAARTSLVNNFNLIFNQDAAPNCSGCAELRHAYRRGDLSGTTDTFLTLVGATAFCNGNQNQDNDPVRRTCAATDRICGNNSGTTLGVVLPVFVPESDPPNPDVIDVIDCQFGNYGFAPVFVEGFPPRCPYDPNVPVFGECLYPQSSAGTVEGGFNCSIAGNFPRPAVAPASFDVREYNRRPRTFAGAVTPEFSALANVPYYRIRAACEEGSSTNQIGCIVNNEACSIGFAGREAVVAPGIDSFGIELQGVSPEDAAGVLNGSYILSRSVFYNSIAGFPNMTVEDEIALETCFSDAERDLLDDTVDAVGFLPFGRNCVSGVCTQSAALGGAPDGRACTVAADCELPETSLVCL